MPRIDYAIYGLCERQGPDFWAEPLNALSSFAFLYITIRLLVYFEGLQILKHRRLWDIKALLILVPCIGIASFVFHTMPSHQNEKIDTLFIVTFILLYFTSALVRIAQAGAFQAVICFTAYAGFTHIVVTQFPDAFNNSIGYLSTMCALIVIAFYLNMKRRAAARDFLVAALIGVMSLFFRSVDQVTCGDVPFGTHFMWHTLNAILIYILMKQLIRSVTRSSKRKIRKERQRAAKLARIAERTKEMGAGI
ncbi:MAG: hypothetical protein K2Q12_08420 [Rickettsiales bacterium]|nr:hypothetical protein [Rickettsiales bacterium]